MTPSTYAHAMSPSIPLQGTRQLHSDPIYHFVLPLPIPHPGVTTCYDMRFPELYQKSVHTRVLPLLSAQLSAQLKIIGCLPSHNPSEQTCIPAQRAGPLFCYPAVALLKSRVLLRRPSKPPTTFCAPYYHTSHAVQPYFSRGWGLV